MTNNQWNYFLSLERELEIISRYVEIAESNYSTYLIEISKLLFSATSEVDVVLKQICEKIDHSSNANNINSYYNIINVDLSQIFQEEVFIPKYGISFIPFENWDSKNSPFWWKAYNKVKHERNNHYAKGNLKNAIYALGGLLVSILYNNLLDLDKNKDEFELINFRNSLRDYSSNLELMILSKKYYPFILEGYL